MDRLEICRICPRQRTWIQTTLQMKCHRPKNQLRLTKLPHWTVSKSFQVRISIWRKRKRLSSVTAWWRQHSHLQTLLLQPSQSNLLRNQSMIYRPRSVTCRSWLSRSMPLASSSTGVVTPVPKTICSMRAFLAKSIHQGLHQGPSDDVVTATDTFFILFWHLGHSNT